MVKKRFEIVFQRSGETIGFSKVGPGHSIKEPITKVYRGVARIYLCTDKGSVYSTNKLEVFEK